DVALRYGWIDSQKQRGDDESFLQKFTPRGPRSVWSKVNREKVERCIVEGSMKPAGLRTVEQARANGQWERAYDSHSRATVPEDLRAALDRNRKAREFFATLSSTNRYAILWRLQTAVRAETRARRLEQFVGMLSRGETLHPQSARRKPKTRGDQSRVPAPPLTREVKP
ncbi:MAG: YdeI/OmpD-associated family protein, partial [Gemmatimonadaceae bacterium]